MLFVILDGAADRKSDELNGSTPFQSARMPNLREISSSAVKGMMYPIAKDIAPESDAAVFSILGYDVADYTGRGPVEAYGAGLKVNERSVGFRCNFATIDKDRNIVDRRAGRIETKDAKPLEKEINSVDLGIDGIRFKFRATVGHRGVCVFYSRKKDLSANVSNADIGYVKRGNISVAAQSSGSRLPIVEPLDGSGESKKTAMIVNAFVDKVVERLSGCETNRSRTSNGMLPANVVLLRDAGVGLPNVETFESRRRMRCAFIAEMPVEMGIARVLGMTPIKLRQIKDRKRRYAKMAELVSQNISNYDFIYVHIKGPEVPGHDGKAALKKEILEEIDKAFFSKIKDIDADICVTCDHATPCAMKSHSSDPVPVMVRYSGAQKADSMPFDEYIKDGTLGIINGNMLIDSIISGRSDAR